MASMQIEGKMPVEVSQQFSGVVAAGTKSRVLYKLLDSLIIGIPYGLSIIASSLSTNAETLAGASIASVFAAVFSMVVLFLAVLNFIMLIAKGRTLGMTAMGLRWVSFRDGRINPIMNFSKSLLESVAGLIFVILAFVTQDSAGRHAFDQITSLITINTKLGRDTATTPAPLVDDSVPHVPQPWNSSSGDPLYAPDGSTVVSSTPSGIINEVPSPLPPNHQPEASYPPAGVLLPDSAGTGAPPSPWALSGEVPLPPAPQTPAAGPSTSAPSPVVPAGAPQSPFAPPIHEVPAPGVAAPNVEQPSGSAPLSGISTPETPAPEAPAVSPFAPPIHEVPFSESAPVPSFAPPAFEAAPAPSFTPPVTLLSTSGDSSAVTEDELDRTIARHPADSVLLTFDDGTHHFLVGQALIGRAPEPEANHPNAQMLPLHDPGRSISKVHLAVSVQSGAVLVEDMHSMNGTTVILPNGTVQAVLPASPVLAPAGSTVYFGERSVKIGG